MLNCQLCFGVYLCNSISVCDDIKNYPPVLSVTLNEMRFPGGKKFSSSQIYLPSNCVIEDSCSLTCSSEMLRIKLTLICLIISAACGYLMSVFSLLFLIKLQIVPQQGKSNCYCHAAYTTIC